MKKLIAGIMIVTLSMSLFACGKKDKPATEDEIEDAAIALADDSLSALNDTMEEGIKAYDEAAEELAKKKQKEKEQEDEDDPANADSTAEYGSQRSAEQMTKEFLGKWEQQGIIGGDGEIGASDAYGTYVIKKDGTYTFNGADEEGKKIKESGKWTLNSKNQLEAGDSTLGIDESGYLLKDTGERDGKGRKIKYAFAKA